MTALSVPRHLAIIMDGNGRWAQERGMPRLEGHRAGAKTVRDITTYCRELGVRYLTLYAFSSENWGRPETEVSGLMQLLADYLKEERATLLKNRIELTTIGATDKLPLLVRGLLAAVKEATRGLDGMRLTLALSYGARDEILRAVRELAAEVKRGKLAIDDIDVAALERHLDTYGTPDPDLLIRTSGEMRISNFMLWQIAYTELYITPVAWPDFTRARLDDALGACGNRQRRFGLTGAQVAPPSDPRGMP
ncbi:MAG: isoprenyl transferase [Deltaproteobacteria bacterium]|nr:isoprenyl transferase [Deltaproteobacteria bacterium]